jgi:hypothetical protein
MADVVTALTRRQRSATQPVDRCAICRFSVSRFDPAVREVFYRGVKYSVCGPCRRRYSHAISQIASSGVRFRFVEKSEIPKPPAEIWNQFFRVYKVLLLHKECEEKRQKEVNWVIEEMTKKLVKLPGRVAAIVRETYSVVGDDFKLTDDEALIRIRDLLEEIDPEIIKRKKKKRLT